jgi:hypothetical protein
MTLKHSSLQNLIPNSPQSFNGSTKLSWMMCNRSVPLRIQKPPWCTLVETMSGVALSLLILLGLCCKMLPPLSPQIHHSCLFFWVILMTVLFRFSFCLSLCYQSSHLTCVITTISLCWAVMNKYIFSLQVCLMIYVHCAVRRWTCVVPPCSELSRLPEHCTKQKVYTVQ